MMGKNKQGTRHAGILTKTGSCLGLGKARGSTGGPSAFPPVKQGKRKIFGVFFCVSHFFSKICYLFFSSHEDHIVGQEPHSLGILKMQTEFWVLFQGNNIQCFVNICKGCQALTNNI